MTTRQVARIRVRIIGDSLELLEGWERILLSGAKRLDPQPLSPIIAILGDDALLKLSPSDIPWPKHDSLYLVLVPRACAHARFASWVRARRHVVAAPHEVAQAVERIARMGIGVREMTRPDEWCPRLPSRGSIAWTALEALDGLDVVHDVKAWAGTLGLTRQVLWAAMRDEIGVSPTDAMVLYVEHQASRAIKRGFHKADVARALGFSDGPGLARVRSRVRGVMRKLRGNRALTAGPPSRTGSPPSEE